MNTQMPGDPVFAEIAERLQLYFDGLYHSDSKRLAEIFHPAARYVCATAPGQCSLSLEEYLPIVEGRPSPAGRKEQRQDRINTIALAGNDMAFVELNCAVGEKYFTDFLTLIRSANEWRIVAKVFRYEIEDSANSAPAGEPRCHM